MKIKKNPIIVVAVGMVAIFATIGSIYGGIQAFIWFSGIIKERYFENEILYQRLREINTGLNVDFVESIVGKPAITKRLPDQLTNNIKTEGGEWELIDYPSGVGEYTERIYVHKKYFLQIITNPEGIISSYAVTTRSPDFNPYVPIELYRGESSGKTYPYISNLGLGKMKLSDLKDYEPDSINISNWGMQYFYVESDYFGNPGFYKHYLFGLSPSGCCVDEDVDYKMLELGMDREDISMNNPKVKELRLKLKPNTFGVINGWENKKLLEYLLKEGLGVNYYDIREFN